MNNFLTISKQDHAPKNFFSSKHNKKSLISIDQGGVIEYKETIFLT